MDNSNTSAWACDGKIVNEPLQERKKEQKK